MSVSVLQRPEGHIINSTEHSAYGSEIYGSGDASFVATSHGLQDGDYIYVVSDIEDYNGFWYVDVTNVNIFKIKPYSGGEFVQYVTDATIKWHSISLTHGWSAVHLPIAYRLSNTLWPVNSSDTVRNITSVGDYNNWSVLNLSGSLGTIHSYDFVKIVVPNDTSLSGVYQIVEWISSTVIIINLQYDSGNNFTSATAQKYYNNYNIVVNVYAGINASHDHAAKKPYELAVTLNVSPDENNEVFFSINEILKAYITTKNNLLLGTLPNNIDFWTNFYIEFGESYDDSDGYALGTYTSSLTSDQSTFEGTAVNAMLEFKNIHSGYLSDYLMTNSAAKFLTLFTIPVLFSCSDDTPDCYNDVSFLNNYSQDITIQKQYYLGETLASTVLESIGELDQGVIRFPIDPSCEYDRLDLTVLAPAETLHNQFVDGTQEVSSNVDWIADGILFGGYAQVNLTSFQNSEEIGFPYLFVKDRTYNINQGIFRFDISGTGSTTIYIRLYETFMGGVFTDLVDEHSFTYSASSEIFSFTPNKNANYIVFFVDRSSGTGTYSFIMLETDIEAIPLSETKTFAIDCGCADQEIRLTWLNNLAGFDNWNFTAAKDHLIEITNAIETKTNIFPEWPKSYGSTADTIRKQIQRTSNKAYTVRSQFLTQDQADAISFIKSSILVQIINSKRDKRTVIVDSDSFVKYQDRDKLYSIAFNISFTDDIPVQSV